ncbi:hypothetical protein DRV84_09530 [Rhodosalinus sediminis]|uniref:Excalibur calcium-binding domain-containing protein n=1 Tax=Rhodosalinus sediminis TaxID=1940533 RepID=A0A3D9BSZ4_9RHOB|nr:hypothetical protein [Rhodosalinus sediminis]REC56506.1 hypothetical protein DRV84_09530 [Rhodosalinus sediminis]
MTSRALGILAACVALAACAPPVPDSGPGFSDYTEYQAARAARDAELAGSAPASSGGGGAPMATVAGEATGAADDALAQARAALEGPEGAAAAPGAAPADPGAPGDPAALSNEQDFEAVSEERGIEGDAERLAEARAQYRVVPPAPLPERGARQGMTPVEFALSTEHAVGQEVYRRSPFGSVARAERNCARYPTPDRAQAAFLAEGGPERDGLGLDPDGDGFVCGWSPAPFRAAVNR